MILTDQLWAKIANLFPKPKWKVGGRGRPVCDFREVFEGICWLVQSGARWKDLPEYYPSYQTCHRRFQQWTRSGTIHRIVKRLCRLLRRRGKVDLHETFIDATFIKAKRGGTLVGNSKSGKGTKIMALCDAQGTPLAACLEGSNRCEVILVKRTLQSRFILDKPRKVVGDKAYDSDPLDRELKRGGIELIAPNRYWKKYQSQDRRKLRPYRRRWKVERLFAWLQNYRRLQTRWEYKAENYHSVVLIGCILLLIKHF